MENKSGRKVSASRATRKKTAPPKGARKLGKAYKSLRTEVAARKLAEEAIKAERQRFIDVLETLPCYLVLLDPYYHVPFANRFFRERFGESHGKRCFEYLFNRTEPCEVCETYKVLKKMEPLEWEWTGPDGRDYYIYDFPFKDSDGSTLIMEVGIDITVQKRALEDLRRARDELEARVQERTAELKEVNRLLRSKVAEHRMAEEKWQTTFDSIADMVSIQDKDFRLVRVNKAYSKAVGMSVEELSGRKCYSVIHQTNCPFENCPHQETIQTSKSVTREIFEPRLGLYLEVSTSPIFNEAGGLIGSVHIAKDITERKKADEALRSRSIELEALNKELESFAYSVSHDLKSPLRSMQGFSQILLEDYADRLNGQGREYLQYISDSSKLMEQLINDLLRLSRITHQEMYIEDVNLSEMAAVAASELKKSSPERRIEFVLAPGLVCRGDSRLLRLVLDNLLGNAWKFTSKVASPRIEFGATEKDGGWAFFVSDNGAGFDMKYAGKLFMPFQRLHKVSEFPGTGIGLATVQRVISRHGGKVSAEGKTGQGATFYFTLGS